MSVKNIFSIIGCVYILTVWIIFVNSSAVLIADFEMTKMIELAAKHPFCKVHKDRGDIQRMLLAADPRRIRQVPRDSVLSLESVCHDTGGSSEEFQGGLGFIYPGTKWCGPGNLAKDYSDLGKYSDEDRCCREHDLCPNTLAPGECRRGLCNTGTFTRSHCDCDARFRRCLQSLNSEIANTLGAVFFNVVQVTCFRERSPCSVWQRFDTSTDLMLINTDTIITSESSLSLDNLNNCPLIYQSSEFYIPLNDKFISRIVNASNSIQRNHHSHTDKSLIARSLNLLHGISSGSTSDSVSDSSNNNYEYNGNIKKYPSSSSSPYVGSNRSYKNEFEDISTRIGVKLASLGLVTANLFKEMVSWPVKDVFYFIQKAHERHEQTRGNSITQN